MREVRNKNKRKPIWVKKNFPWPKKCTEHTKHSARIALSNLHLTLFPLVLLNLDPIVTLGFQGGSAGEESACHTGDLGLISGLGRLPRGGPGNPLQYSYLGNPRDYNPQHRKKSGTTEMTEHTQAHKDSAISKNFTADGASSQAEWSCSLSWENLWASKDKPSCPTEVPLQMWRWRTGSGSWLVTPHLSQHSAVEWKMIHHIQVLGATQPHWTNERDFGVHHSCFPIHQAEEE